MDTKLRLQYDREGDILYLSLRAPYPEQETEELADEVIARINPDTNELESLEFLFFSTRLAGEDLFEIPVEGSLRLTIQKEPPKLTNTELWEKVKGLEGEVVHTLVDSNPNKIVEVTANKVVIEGKTYVSRTKIYEAYQELWENRSLGSENRSKSYGSDGPPSLRYIIPPIILNALQDQLEHFTWRGRGGRKFAAIRFKTGSADHLKNQTAQLGGRDG